MPTNTTEELGSMAGEAVERLVLAGGLTDAEATDLVADVLDLLTPVEVLRPGPVGLAADEALDVAIRHLVDGLWEMGRRPLPALIKLAKKAERAGRTKRALRLRKRIGRRAD